MVMKLGFEDVHATLTPPAMDVGIFKSKYTSSQSSLSPSTISSFNNFAAADSSSGNGSLYNFTSSYTSFGLSPEPTFSVLKPTCILPLIVSETKNSTTSSSHVPTAKEFLVERAEEPSSGIQPNTLELSVLVPTL